VHNNIDRTMRNIREEGMDVMSNITVKTSGPSIGFLSLLAILFIGLKLTGYITWSWLAVLSPLWLPLAVFGIMVVTVMALVAIIALLKVVK